MRKVKFTFCFRIAGLLLTVCLLFQSLNTVCQSVGITDGATFTPNYLLHLHLNSNSGTAFQLTNLQSSNAASHGFIFKTINTNSLFNLQFNNQDSGYLSFFTNNKERIRLTENGLIGIGITNPSQKLTVWGNTLIQKPGGPDFIVQNSSYTGEYVAVNWSGNYPYFNIVSANDPFNNSIRISNGSIDFWKQGASATFRQKFNEDFIFYTGYFDERFRIKSSGYVGIGSTAPASMLSVGSTSQFQVNSTGDIVKINNVTTTWPSSQGGANTFLKNDGSGTFSWASGSLVPSLTAGSVIFSDGSSLTQDNSNFFWDNTNKRLAIGSNTFDATNPEKLKVDAGSSGSFNVISGYGNINNYLQLNIRNINSGISASSDIVATNNNGNESYGYIDMGINSTGYTQAAYNITAANDAYLYCVGQSSGLGGNLSIGTATASTAIKFHAGGTTSSDEKMRINSSGYVGINTTNPGNRLEVNSGSGGASGLRLKQLPVGSVLFINSNSDVAQSNQNLYFDPTNYRFGVATGSASANSTLQIGGSVSFGIKRITAANYTASTNDYTILGDSSITTTISLPDAAGCKGRIYVFKKINTGDLVISKNGGGCCGSQKIDGGNSVTISTQYETLMIESDGTTWWIIGKF